jgi:hypothetical protein
MYFGCHLKSALRLLSGSLWRRLSKNMLASGCPSMSGAMVKWSSCPRTTTLADVALHASHPLARREIVDLDDLRSDRWITWGQTGSILSDMHIPARWCDQWLVYTLRSRGHEPVIAHTACEHATQFALVAAGLGICVIPRLGRDPLPRGVRIVAVKPMLRRHVYALWRSSNTRLRAIGVMVEAFRTSASMIAKVHPTIATKGARKRMRNRTGSV